MVGGAVFVQRINEISLYVKEAILNIAAQERADKSNPCLVSCASIIPVTFAHGTDFIAFADSPSNSC